MSPEAEPAWSRAALVRHFDWQRWRNVKASSCRTLMRWLAPRSHLITHLCLDAHLSRKAEIFRAWLPALRSLAIVHLGGVDGKEVVEDYVRLGAPLTELSCQNFLPHTLPFVGLQSLTLRLAACTSSMRTTLRGQLHLLPLLARLDVSFGSVPCCLEEALPFCADWITELRHPLPSLRELFVSQTDWYSVEDWDPSGAPDWPVSNLTAQQHWSAVSFIEEKSALLPLLAAFSLDLRITLEVSEEDPALQASVHTVSLVRYEGTGSQKAVMQRTAAFDISEKAWVDEKAWEEAWEDMVSDALRSPEDCPFPLSTSCLLEICKGVQRFRQGHGLPLLE